MRFAPEYVANVLNDNFEDAKTLLLAPLMSIHYAHLVMLTERHIISRDDARVLAPGARRHLGRGRPAKWSSTAPARTCSSTSST